MMLSISSLKRYETARMSRQPMKAVSTWRTCGATTSGFRWERIKGTAKNRSMALASYCGAYLKLSRGLGTTNRDVVHVALTAGIVIERGVAFHLHSRNTQVFQGHTTKSFQFAYHSRVRVPLSNPVPARLFQSPLTWPSKSAQRPLISVSDRCS